MKKLLLIVSILCLASCTSPQDSLNCFQTAGTIIETEMSVAPFTKIIVWERAQLFISQGETQKVVIETGENLLDDVELQVIDGELNIYNNNSCNLVRDYGITKVYVTSPNITQIRSSTGLTTESIGVLRFPELLLLSEDQNNEDEFHTDGDFRLDLEIQNLRIVANGLSRFYLKGTAETADFGLFSSDCGIESRELIVQNLNIFHRSTDVMVVNPQQSITGRIVSVGNCISVNRPPIVNVETPYRGELIFE
ncbi:MAG: head GIN domain-containing protein [Patiriisocius sp.]|uniref:head GIN domain-containing protein n=1 Tax=Patiriisocius sp. TaxID=2822396 RepID=UPI003EFAD70D